MKEKKWRGTWPTICNLCDISLKDQKYFVDGITKYGTWALMCPQCHMFEGVGLGLGRGQRYDSRTLLKMEG